MKMLRSLVCGHILQIKPMYSIKQWQQLPRVMISRHQLLQKCTNSYIPFPDLMKSRCEEAKRSIIVQVQSAHSSKELYAYCKQFGCVKHMFHYTTSVEPLHFILVEFESESDVTNILKVSTHMDDSQTIPVHSPFLWFKIGSGPNKNAKYKLELENGTSVPTNEEINDLLAHCESISDQIKVLHETTKLNDLGIRLRFLTARQVELAMIGMFPDAAAYPFGSSINGYGKLGCDLDLILKLNPTNKVVSKSRLVYQCKAGLGNERSQSQRHMETIGDLLHLFLPGCAQIRRILQARVPILKYNQSITDIECDLSMTNMIALHMSELLYVFGSLDERVRPLVFTIRKWAEAQNLTNSSPGRWITNFSITLLVLAFLQRAPILPSVNALIKHSSITEPGIQDDYLSIENLTKLKQTKNTDNLETLLKKFYVYYSNFDFETKGISLNEATVIPKPEHSPLYIVNPLERALNVSKNVSIEELERLRLEFRNASWILESDEKKTGKWGLLNLFYNNNNKLNMKTIMTTSKNLRIMDVKKLFEDEPTIVFKNVDVEKQVDNIRKETMTRIQEISRTDNIKERRRRRRR